jgi:hypothetical protein
VNQTFQLFLCPEKSFFELICRKATVAIKELLTDPAQGKRITNVSLAKKIGFLGLVEKHLD